MMTSNGFERYIAKDRIFGDWRFDFLISNDVAREWYDASPAQYMPERRMCVERIKPGDIVVDCGAHHGMMALIFAKAVGTSGRVFAYEALPGNARIIEENAALNGVSNIVVRPVGVGERRARLPIHENQSNVMVAEGEADPQAPHIDIVALDEDLPRDVKVDFLKVDVEGHDLAALRGMTRIIAGRPVIDLELHNLLFSDRRSVLAGIGPLLDGYRFTVLEEIFSEPKAMARFDIDYLSRFENPHVFCDPV